ncbi:MAG TPA: hypothetical protein DCL98_05885, partial [Flavobacteriales bacterium]|nr:hypothetical protein [Flavobacteriales bacterium]
MMSTFQFLSKTAMLAFVVAVSLPMSAQLSFWSPASQKDRATAPAVEVSTFDAYDLDVARLEAWLAEVPHAAAFEARTSEAVLALPLPNGRVERFRVVNSPIMAPELAARFPDIQVFAGQGVDTPVATVRFDLTPQGFHAMVMGVGETVFIDPHTPGDREHVIVYTRAKFYASTSKRTEGCMALELPQAGKEDYPTVSPAHPAGKEVQTMGLKPVSAASRV